MMFYLACGLLVAKRMRIGLVLFGTAFVGLIFLGSLGAFLLFVPVLSVVTVTLLLIALILMFVLGVQAGGRLMPQVEQPDEPAVTKSGPSAWQRLSQHSRDFVRALRVRFEHLSNTT